MTDAIPNIDIRPDHWVIVRDILARHVPDREVWAFGSRATWTAKDYSDLDLVILGDHPLPPDARAAMGDDFSESELPYKVDVVEWAGLGGGFKEIIRRDRVVVRGKPLDWFGEVGAPPSGAHGATQPGQEADGNHPRPPGGSRPVTQEVHLVDLLSFTRDGEWGNGEPSLGHSPALVIRGTDFSLIRTGNLTTLPLRYIRSDVLARKAITAGDILIETAGGTKDQPTGRSVLISSSIIAAAKLPLVCASFARVLRPDSARIDSQFLFWKLQDEYESRRMFPYHVQHTGVARFQYTQFAKSHPLTLPSLPYQRKIASVLGALDDKIESNRRMNETLEAMARAIFKDWFVDFGPTRAKMEGRPPYLAPDIWSLFPDRLDDEGKPEGWGISTVGAEFNLTMGQSPPGETYNETGDGLPFFQGRTDFGFRYPVRRKFCSAPTRIARADDTLVSVRAPVGDLNMAWEECCIGRGVAAVRHKRGGRGYTQYLMQFMQPAIARFEDSGSVFGAINKVQFERLPVIVPREVNINELEVIVQEMDDRIRLNVAENETLAATRDYLLPKLMSGEVRIKDAEKLISEVA